MKPYKVLIVKMSSIGDVLQTIPVTRYLKDKYPSCEISWIIEKKHEHLLKTFEAIDHVITFDTSFFKNNIFSSFQRLFSFKKEFRKERYDVVFDLQGNCKSALMTLLSRSKEKIGFDKKSVAEWPNLLVTSKKIRIDQEMPIQKQYLSLVRTYYNDVISDKWITTYHQKELHKRVMVCPGSFWKNKQLSMETLAEFLEKIHQKYGLSFIFIWGTDEEKRQVDDLQKKFDRISSCFGRLKWNHWQQMMKNVDAVISVDSCALHLAALNNIPTFSCFGPSSSLVYKPMGLCHVAYQGECPFNVSFVKRCPILRTCQTGSCMKNISSESLEKAFEGFWRNLVDFKD